jgi:alpha-mannosidase
MIFTTDGTPLQGSLALLPPEAPLLTSFTGITGGFGGDRRVDYIIQPEDRAKGSYSFVIESSCNGMFGVPWNGDTIAPPDVSSLTTPRAIWLNHLS